jgi:hypothetical protein
MNQSFANMEVNQGANNNVNGSNGARRTMADFARPVISRTDSSITRPRVEANNFEIKPNIIPRI